MMFKLFHKSRAKSSDLPLSTLYDEYSFYKSFIHNLMRAKHNVVIESPFMTKSRALQLVSVLKKLHKRGVKIRVNTRHPNSHNNHLYYQTWQAAEVLRSHGASVRFYKDMRHRKIAIIDDRILWEGSLNILSHKNSREIMRRTESEKLCRQMIHFTGVNRRFR